jgi:hypothetical protein
MAHRTRIILFIGFGLLCLAIVFSLTQIDWSMIEERSHVLLQRVFTSDDPDFVGELAREIASNTDTLNIESGTYLVYTVTTIVDEGKENWPNDDIEEVVFYRYRVGDEDPVEFFRKRRGVIENDGGLTSVVYGKDLLAHRYGTDEAGVIDLTGTVETRPDKWGTLRSENGHFQVDYASIYDDDISGVITLTNLERGVSEHIDLFALDSDKIDHWTTPTYVGDYGDWILLTSGLPREGFDNGNSTILYHVDSGSLLDLSENNELRKIMDNEGVGDNRTDPNKEAFWSFYPNLGSIILTVFTKRAESNAMMGWEPGAPMRVYEIDAFAKKDMRVLLEDKRAYLQDVGFSPDGKSMHYSVNGDDVWIAPIGATPQNAQRVTSGRLLDRLKNGIVVEREQGDIVYIDLDDRNVTTLDRSIGDYKDRDYQRVEFIGAITIP